MAYTPQEFLALDLSTRPSSAPNCANCAHSLKGVRKHDIRDTDAGPMHEECYFDVLGDISEKPPTQLSPEPS